MEWTLGKLPQHFAKLQPRHVISEEFTEADLENWKVLMTYGLRSPFMDVTLSGPHAVGKSFLSSMLEENDPSKTFKTAPLNIQLPPIERGVVLYQMDKDIFTDPVWGSFSYYDGLVRSGQGERNWNHIVKQMGKWRDVERNLMDDIKLKLHDQVAQSKSMETKRIPPLTHRDDEVHRFPPLYRSLFHDAKDGGVMFQGLFMANFIARWATIQAGKQRSGGVPTNNRRHIMEHSFADILIYSVAYFIHAYARPKETWLDILTNAVEIYTKAGSLGHYFVNHFEVLNICIMSPTRRHDFIERGEHVGTYPMQFEDILECLYEMWRLRCVYLGPVIFIIRHGKEYCVDSIQKHTVDKHSEQVWRNEVSNITRRHINFHFWRR